MPLGPVSRRRWFGALVLLAALAMVVAGQTLLKDRLADVVFLCYWVVCLGLTGIAVFIALVDVRSLHHQSRRDQRDLLQSTLKNIEKDVRSKPDSPRK